MELSDPLPKFLIARVRIHGRRQRRDVPGEPLRQEQVARPMQPAMTVAGRGA